MKNYNSQHTTNRRHGSVLVFVMIAVLLLMIGGMGLLTITYGSRVQAIRLKNQTVAMLTAEAGYEQTIFWMNQQPDLLTSLRNNAAGSSGSITYGNSTANYSVQFCDYLGMQPVFQVIATGICGAERRMVDVYVIQAISGWAMGKCRIPSSNSADTPVNFASGEIIDMPLHINNLKDSPDNKDIYISGTPDFRQKVEMGESRYTTGGSDKYSGVTDMFDNGISFDQPNVQITDKTAVDSKLASFKDVVKTSYVFTPVASTLSGVTGTKLPAVQLEFYKDSGGTGKVKITNNCTVVGYKRAAGKTYDYKRTTSGSNPYMTYDTYAYHYKSNTSSPVTDVPLTDTYVTQTFDGKQTVSGGRIYVNGNVVIGSSAYDQLVVKGQVTVVATGNIWIADPVFVDGVRDGAGMPAAGNSNVLGLVSGGVVKVIDPGISSYANGGTNSYPGPPKTVSGFSYAPVANAASATLGNRILPSQMVVEAAVTCGGGGWGAENVQYGSYGGRRQTSSSANDMLILRGSICEAIRGIVGIGTDGYLKQYYYDKRLMNGILPGDIWFGGKYVPAPAGWHDYRATN